MAIGMLEAVTPWLSIVAATAVLDVRHLMTRFRRLGRADLGGLTTGIGTADMGRDDRLRDR
jgi:hypothetical protein